LDELMLELRIASRLSELRLPGQKGVLRLMDVDEGLGWHGLILSQATTV
jgi:hypothetical protein